MALLSLAYVLLNRPMQRRFDADPMLRATDLLLQERVPRASTPVFPHAAEAGARRLASAEEQGTMRVFTDPGGASPEIHLLSNGRYHVAVTSAGGGYSRWQDFAVTRWREDATRDSWGSFCYLRDVDTGAVWSTSYQPTLKFSRLYEAIFTQARAEFRRRDWDIECHTEISVSPEDDIELRGHQLRRGGSRAAQPGFIRAGVQQSVCEDGTGARPPGDSLHAATAVGPGATAMADAFDDRGRVNRWRGIVRDRSHEIHRSRSQRRQSGSDGCRRQVIQ
jgi:hypothetical protein